MDCDLQIELLENACKVAEANFPAIIKVEQEDYFDPQSAWRIKVIFNEIADNASFAGSMDNPLQLRVSARSVVDLCAEQLLYTHLKNNLEWMYDNYVPKDMRSKK